MFITMVLNPKKKLVLGCFSPTTEKIGGVFVMFFSCESWGMVLLALILGCEVFLLWENLSGYRRGERVERKNPIP